MFTRTAAATLLAGLGIVMLATGCGPKVTEKDFLDVTKVHGQAVDKMLWHARHCVPRDTRVLVATFVDLDDVTSTSTLGRLMGEACATRLSHWGYPVVNVKVRDGSMVITPEGEFLLSRDARQLSQDYDARLVLVGTYTRTHVAPYIRSLSSAYEEADPKIELRYPAMNRELVVLQDYLYVSMRLVDPRDNTVVAAYDYRMPCDEGLLSMTYAASQ